MYPNHLSRGCQADSFCLPQTCTDLDDLYSLAHSDAKLICDFYKLSQGVATCDEVRVFWDCHGRSGGPYCQFCAIHIVNVALIC